MCKIPNPKRFEIETIAFLMLADQTVSRKNLLCPTLYYKRRTELI